MRTKLFEFNKLLETDNLYAPTAAAEEIFSEKANGKTKEKANTSELDSAQNKSFALKIAENNIKLAQTRIRIHEASASPKISLEGYAGWLPYSEQDLEKRPEVGLALVATLDITDRFMSWADKPVLLTQSAGSMSISSPGGGGTR